MSACLPGCPVTACLPGSLLLRKRHFWYWQPHNADSAGIPVILRDEEADVHRDGNRQGRVPEAHGEQHGGELIWRVEHNALRQEKSVAYVRVLRICKLTDVGRHGHRRAHAGSGEPSEAEGKAVIARLCQL